MSNNTRPFVDLWAEYLDLARWIAGPQSEENEAVRSAAYGACSETERAIMQHPDKTPAAMIGKLIVLRTETWNTAGDPDIDACLSGMIAAITPAEGMVFPVDLRQPPPAAA